MTTNSISWLNEIKQKHWMQSKAIRFSNSKEWSFNKSELIHKTQKFFKIQGIKAVYTKTNKQYIFPIINQPEIGILGYAVKRIDNEYFFLVQAKIEPGNVGGFQFAPTVQATESNYTRVHGGQATPYLNYFMNKEYKVLHDTLQTEQGWKFLNKRNRSIVVEIPNDTREQQYYKYISLIEILSLLRKKNILNSDSRAVIVSLLLNYPEIFPYSRNLLKSSIRKSLHISSINQKKLVNLFTRRKGDLFKVSNVSLFEMQDWKVNDYKIVNKNKELHEVIQIQVSTDSREVTNWDQPIVNSHDTEKLILIGKIEDGTLKILLCSDTQPGLITDTTASVTLSSSTSFDELNNSYKLRQWLGLNKNNAKFFKKTENSEEGGRFYFDKCIYEFYIFDELNNFPDRLQNHHWVTLNDCKTLLNEQLILTNELRSCLSFLLSFGY